VYRTLKKNEKKREREREREGTRLCQLPEAAGKFDATVEPASRFEQLSLGETIIRAIARVRGRRVHADAMPPPRPAPREL